MTAIDMPAKPSTEPIERSMLRITMIRTMPLTITPTEAVCTERFQRFRAVRKMPPVRR